jgi:ATP-dependent Clp protease ATP-binding subunit ClpC
LRKSVFGQSLPSVNYKRVVELDMSVLLAEISNPEEVETVLDRIFQEVTTAGNVILIINEFHNFIGVKPGPGMIDISGVISSYLHLPQFQVVAITSYEGLHKNIEQNPSINNLFEKVEVFEPSEKETMVILENFSLQLEAKYKLFVSYPALRETMALCQRFLPSLPFPKKALDLLDEVMVHVKGSSKERIVLPSHVAKIISQKTQIPVGEMESQEKEKLLNLENLIHQRIINQSEAVTEVSTALRRARSEINVKSAPMGTFLFLGPTGVGKTETAKALTEIYFGSESKMIRLDMSEFQNVKDIPRLLGSAGEEGLLTTAVKENPFSLILLDEIEKAHPNVLNLFLQVLDEGFLTDGVGRKIDFKNTIIIATSNAGYQLILQAIKENSNWQELHQKMLDYLFEKGTFRPEFINRFDAMVIFKPLTQENLMDISALMLSKIQRGLKIKGIELIITDGLKRKVAELGYDPKFGARQMKRVVQDKVENELASALLSNLLVRGNRVEVNPEDFSLKISRI